MQADSRKIISENIVADRSKLKIICVFLHRIYFGRIPYERQYRGKKRKAMNITELQQSYASHPNVEGVCRLLKDNSVRHLYCGGLYASAASLFSSVLVQRATCPLVFILGDMEEAGYFYHDLTQILGTEQVLFFPSSFSPRHQVRAEGCGKRNTPYRSAESPAKRRRGALRGDLSGCAGRKGCLS